jgi:threonine/homoserine/homoserine lactone efflux protein
MIDSTNLVLFVIASWALIVSPGPDMLYVITRGISQGRAAGLLSALGVTTGLLVHTTLAALGLGALLQTSTLLFLLVKYAGAAYLIYLGVRAFFDKGGIVLQQQTQSRARVIFVQGMLSNVLNPKVVLFFLAFLPQFVDDRAGNTTLQMIVLGMIFTIFGVLFLSALGYFSGQIGNWIARRPNLTARLRWVTSSVLVGLGVRLAFTKRG